MFSASWRSTIEAGGVSSKYLVVAFTSDGRQDEELDARSSAMMRALHHSKTRAIEKGKALGVKSIFVPILTYGRMSLGQ